MMLWKTLFLAFAILDEGRGNESPKLAWELIQGFVRIWNHTNQGIYVPTPKSSGEECSISQCLIKTEDTRKIMDPRHNLSGQYMDSKYLIITPGGTDGALSYGDYHKGAGLYPSGEPEEARMRYDLPQGPLQPLQPLVKVEYAYEDSEDSNPKMVTKEVPYTATELAKLKKEYSRSPKESETEDVWRVSLTGGDQIMLSERDAEGYWGPGVFLTTGDHRAPWSLTQRAAYWAGGLNPLERGDPLALTGSVDQLVENVQKAACLQMMYDQELKLRQESPMMIPVDPERMTPLIRGLPDSLKPLGIQLQGTIRNTPQSAQVTAALTGALTPDRHIPGQKVWTWGEVAQELINYGRKYGPVKSEPKNVRRTEAKFPPVRPSPPNLVNLKRDSTSRRKALWIIGLFVVSLALREAERTIRQQPIILRGPLKLGLLP
ncbi:uncharacterized protein [Nyctibius grandis]|uniref:uncharacterized protein n=1 Tax=Nyctibius grandis TaxID=48427 RepID=UPI0035BBD380